MTDPGAREGRTALRPAGREPHGPAPPRPSCWPRPPAGHALLGGHQVPHHPCRAMLPALGVQRRSQVPAGGCVAIGHAHTWPPPPRPLQEAAGPPGGGGGVGCPGEASGPLQQGWVWPPPHARMSPASNADARPPPWVGLAQLPRGGAAPRGHHSAPFCAKSPESAATPTGNGFAVGGPGVSADGCGFLFAVMECSGT